jgi:glycosyltransferase involved in cell wall biosynthesis
LTLVTSLERALPATLPAGRASAVFCVGLCEHDERRVEQLRILVDGVPHRPSAFGMPRPDRGSAHGGFWGTVPIPAHAEPARVQIELEAGIERGGRERAPLGEVLIVGPEPPAALGAAADAPGPGLIAVCMATFEPDAELFEAQLGSLRSQDDRNWICLISDDCSAPEKFEVIERAVGSDQRFAISRSETRLGFYRNFERAIGLAPAGAELIALCDQDDRWHPDKLAVLRGALGEAVLAYSDQRLVDAGGAVLRETLWRGRRNNYDSLTSMLVANTITGAATLFRRELLDVLLPFPDTPGYQFHDHWLAVAALAAGELSYVDRPLYDYVQHAGAVFGDVTFGRRRTRRDRTPGRARGAYFHGYLAREAQAQVLLARIEALTPTKRRALKRLIACDTSPFALAWLALRPARMLLGRTETLASESELAYGVLWKQLAVALRRSPRGPFANASIPPPDSFTQKRLRRWRASI